HLDTPADREEREVVLLRPLEELQLEGVALRHGLDARVVDLLPVALGGNVLPTGQHQAVEELVERPERRSTVGGRQQHRNAAGFLDRDDVRLVEKGATGAELGRHDRRRETNPGRSHGRHANIPWLTCQNADSRLTPAPSCVAITSYPLDGAA